MSDAPETPKARRLAGAALILKAPTSLASRWDVVLLSQVPGAENRALAAALGLCWPRFAQRRPYTGNALQYGGQVIDILLAEGARMGEILAAGSEALFLCSDGLVSVEGASDFSTPPAA